MQEHAEQSTWSLSAETVIAAEIDATPIGGSLPSEEDLCPVKNLSPHLVGVLKGVLKIHYRTRILASSACL